jgi:hypothetical protein
MTSFDDGSVGYPGPNARLRFEQAHKPYEAKPNHLYWKIAIAVPDIELAYEQLSHKDIVMKAPYQFQEIGYLAHLADPEGFTVELIEHSFKGQAAQVDLDKNSLGGGPHINLLTLRAGNIPEVSAACAELGMKALSIQRVEPDRFTLYFYAFTNDVPPSTDLTSVENRPWLYQRSYTVLEIQKYHKPTSTAQTDPDEAGYDHVIFTNLDNYRLSDASKTCLQSLQIKIL